MHKEKHGGGDSSKGSISVIIPMFNVEHFIGQCLESIQWQLKENDKVICVDGDDCFHHEALGHVREALRNGGDMRCFAMELLSDHGDMELRGYGVKESRHYHACFAPPTFVSLFSLQHHLIFHFSLFTLHSTNGLHAFRNSLQPCRQTAATAMDTYMDAIGTPFAS